MKHDREIEVFRFREKGFDRIYTVMFWEDYGVVCPNFVTTNGSAGFFAGSVSDDYEVVEVLACDPGSLGNTMEVIRRLVMTYRGWMQKINGYPKRDIWDPPVTKLCIQEAVCSCGLATTSIGPSDL